MKIIFWAKGERGISCLKAFYAKGWKAELLVLHPEDHQEGSALSKLAREFKIEIAAPEDPNSPQWHTHLKEFAADLFVLAGYGKILKAPAIAIPRLGCINLHGGKLPEYRGSSPLNWALINGEKSFTLSVIKVDAGVDSGDVLLDRTFNIEPTFTIRDLHRIANEQFPQMMLEVIENFSKGKCKGKAQDKSKAGYFPLRFAEDGLVLWDYLKAEQIHNRIRALTEPYPCAFTFWNGRKIKLTASELTEIPYHGEPGRIYQKNMHGVLVCASDVSLWITKAVFEDGEDAIASMKRYERFATVHGWVAASQVSGVTS